MHHAHFVIGLFLSRGVRDYDLIKRYQLRLRSKVGPNNWPGRLQFASFQLKFQLELAVCSFQFSVFGLRIGENKAALQRDLESNSHQFFICTRQSRSLGATHLALFLQLDPFSRFSLRPLRFDLSQTHSYTFFLSLCRQTGAWLLRMRASFSRLLAN